MNKPEQIKEKLIPRIKDSKDMNFLKVSQTICNSSEQALYELNIEQQSFIETSRTQIENGSFHKNEDVMSEMKEWLKEKQ